MGENRESIGPREKDQEAKKEVERSLQEGVWWRGKSNKQQDREVNKRAWRILFWRWKPRGGRGQIGLAQLAILLGSTTPPVLFVSPLATSDLLSIALFPLSSDPPRYDPLPATTLRLRRQIRHCLEYTQTRRHDEPAPHGAAGGGAVCLI